MSCYLGLDFGTQSVKALVLDAAARRIVAAASAPLALTSRADGTREQRAEWWLAALEAALAEIDADLKASIIAIGVSGQQHGFVPLDTRGQVLAPVKLWCDTTTVQQCERITTAFGGQDRCIAEVGNAILPGYTAPKILWLKQHHRDRYDRLDTILLPHDYINFHLTGERVMECGDASGTGLLDIRSRGWHRAMLNAVDDERDLADCLPALAPADGFIGQLRRGVARELGLPAGLPVSCGGGDNMMAAIGTGNVAAGRLTVSLGTSGTLFAYADEAVVDASGTLAAFCDSTGGWLPLLCTMNCTVATELTRSMLELPLAAVEASVESIPVGSQGVMTVPWFQGERTPDLPSGQGCILGLNQDNYTPGHLLRSAMESATYGLRFGLEAFRRSGSEISGIRLTGGGANSAAWRQMTADIFRLPVSVQRVDEGAALGGALQACWVHNRHRGETTSIVDLVDQVLELDETRCCVPDPSHADAYDEHYGRYLRHVEAITPLYS